MLANRLWVMTKKRKKLWVLTNICILLLSLALYTYTCLDADETFTQT